MIRVVLLLIGYFLGIISTGYIFGKMKHMDIREHGSGNAGATNTLRVMGVKAGLIVFLGDFFKAFLPCVLVRYLFGWNSGLGVIYMLYMGLGVALGHNFPFYLKFKGGKGVASTAGLIVALDLRITLVCLFVFILIVFLTRFVSLASICVMVILMVMASFFSFGYGVHKSLSLEFYILILTVGCLSIFRHKANILRLLHGTESKIGIKKA